MTTTTDARSSSDPKHISFTTCAPKMPLLSISSEVTIAKCAALPLCSSDIFICSYPKSGTTWTQHIVLSLLLLHQRNTSDANTNNIPDYQHISDYAPFFEIDDHWEEAGSDNVVLSAKIREAHELLGRRVFNTHLRFDMLPRGNKARWIYILRSPLDVCVSYYHHLVHQVQGGYKGTLDEFYQAWLAGNIAFGSWMDHVLSFAVGISTGQTVTVPHSNAVVVLLPDGRMLLLISYQDMMDNLPRVVQDIQEFLGLESITSEQRDDLLPSFTFANMKQHIHKFQPCSVQWKDNFSFLRKGISGDSLKELSDEQHQQFQKCLKQRQLHKKLKELLSESHPLIHDKIQSLLPN